MTPADDGGTGWWLAGYAGVAGFFALEGATRERGSASSLEVSGDDQGTTRRIVTAYAVAIVASPLLRGLPLPPLPRGAGPVGVALEAVGFGVRAWSMRTLGHSYSRTLRTEEEQGVVETGPYRRVRHPGYAGSLLIWTGFALSSRRLPVVAAIAVLLVPAYRRRIAAEEQLLRRDLPSYASYCDRTKKLIPFVW